MKLESSRENQVLICYALLGYLEFIKCNGKGDRNYNFIFGPRNIVELMKQACVDKNILEVIREIDEVESIISRSGIADYEKSIYGMKLKLLSFIKGNFTYTDNTVPALTKLIAK